MDSRFVLQHVPNADPMFLKIVAVIAVSGTAAAKISEVLPVLHQLFLQKREAFHRGDWRMFHSAIDREAELIAQVAS
jgi:hypothetical protein